MLRPSRADWSHIRIELQTKKSEWIYGYAGRLSLSTLAMWTHCVHLVESPSAEFGMATAWVEPWATRGVQIRLWLFDQDDPRSRQKLFLPFVEYGLCAMPGMQKGNPWNIQCNWSIPWIEKFEPVMHKGLDLLSFEMNGVHPAHFAEPDEVLWVITQILVFKTHANQFITVLRHNALQCLN